MLVDIVNLNPDNSCLPREKWVRALQTGKFETALRNYIVTKRKVNLGLIGVAIRDMKAYSPKSLDLINSNPNVFQIVGRPFSHSIYSLFQRDSGFETNLQMGLREQRKEFINTNSFYLPPEIDPPLGEIRALVEQGILGTFCHKERFSEDELKKIADHPFWFSDPEGDGIIIIPFQATGLLRAYYRALNGFPVKEWVECLNSSVSRYNLVFFWRDFESVIINPFGYMTERFLLESEKDAGIERFFLSELEDTLLKEREKVTTLPIQDMSPWLGTETARKMYADIFSFVKHYFPVISKLPKSDDLVDALLSLILIIQNSDILSSLVKRPPKITIKFKTICQNLNIPENSFWQSDEWNGIDIISINQRNGVVEAMIKRDRRFEQGKYWLDIAKAGGNGILKHDLSRFFQKISLYENASLDGKLLKYRIGLNTL